MLKAFFPIFVNSLGILISVADLSNLAKAFFAVKTEESFSSESSCSTFAFAGSEYSLSSCSALFSISLTLAKQVFLIHLKPAYHFKI
nr:hypothetical protein [Mycoplasmopsis bovis]